MVAQVEIQLPAELLRHLEEFCAPRKTGKFVLDIKDGQVVAWEATERRRVAHG